MTPEQEQFVAMLENTDLMPNLTMMDENDWEYIEIELRDRADVITLTFNSDGKLIAVDRGNPLTD